MRSPTWRAGQHPPAREQHHQRRDDDDGPPDREINAADRECTFDRLPDRSVLTAEQATNGFPDHQSNCVSPKHRDDRRGIEAPDYDALHHQAHQANDDRRGEDAEPETEPGRGRKIHRIGAEQHEFAVSEIKDAHHAGDDTETQHDQNHHGTERGDVEDQCHRIRACPLVAVSSSSFDAGGRCFASVTLQGLRGDPLLISEPVADFKVSGRQRRDDGDASPSRR